MNKKTRSFILLFVCLLALASFVRILDSVQSESPKQDEVFARSETAAPNSASLPLGDVSASQSPVPQQTPVQSSALQEGASQTNVSQENESRYGGRIIFGTIGEPSNLLPFLASDSASHEIGSYFYVAPLKYDKDLSITTWAAQSYEVLEGETLLRFTLKPGIFWQDGVELTADDVEFTYRIMVDPKTPTAYAEDFLRIKEFRKTGRYTFEVRYEKPFARSLITWMTGILPKHALEGQDLSSTPLSRKPLSSGPYILKEWEAGSKLVLVANERYFEGRPYIDEVIYRIIPDLATMFLELKAGKLDMMNLTPQQYRFQTNGPQWEKDWRKYAYLSSGYTFLGYNLRHPFFQDARVRRAITCGIDRKSIVSVVLFGEGLTTIGPYQPGTWVYNTAIKEHPYDPQLAAQLLREAGWIRNPETGILEKDGVSFRFTILTNQGNTQRINVAVIIQSMLKELGIEVQVRTVEWAAFIREFVDKGNFDAIILGWNILADPDVFNVWHSSKAVSGGLNFTWFKNAEVDEILEEACSTMDQARRKVLYDRFQEILHEEQPYTFLYIPNALSIVNARYHGIEPAPAGLMYDFIHWWIARNKKLVPQP